MTTGFLFILWMLGGLLFLTLCYALGAYLDRRKRRIEFEMKCQRDFATGRANYLRAVNRRIQFQKADQYYHDF